MVNSEFWRGRRVLLTGHTGFKGAWLSLWLQRLGAKVCGLALPPSTQPNLFELAGIADGMDHRVGDIRNIETVASCLKDVQPEIVIHMAAQSLVRESYADPVGTFSTNVMGTVHVLDVCRSIDAVRAIVIVTSDKCYESKGPVRAHLEDDPLGGDDPYSGSKGAAELATHSYRFAFFSTGGNARVASARAGNVIGGGDWSKDRLLPDFFRAATRGDVLQIRSPNAVRPWQYVLEPLRGYLILAERLHSGTSKVDEAWNFGPLERDSRTVLSVIETLKKLWPDPVAIATDRRPHLKELETLRLDASKASSRLGWRPRIALEECLRLTSDWYLNVCCDALVARRYSTMQIEAYEPAAAA